MTEWLTLKELAAYSRLGQTTLKLATHRRDNRLPSHFIGGRRLYRRDEYDAWANRHRAKADATTARARAKLGL